MNAIAIGSAILLSGLAPSFLDWQQSPEKRTQFVLYYAALIGLTIYAINSTMER